MIAAETCEWPPATDNFIALCYASNLPSSLFIHRKSLMSRRAKICSNVLETIGHTSLVRLNRLPEEGSAEVVVKLESFNPMRSIKDRIACAMIEGAESEGLISPGTTQVIEPTS